MDAPDPLPTAVLFKIDAAGCDLCVGDGVAPGTRIGDAFASDTVLEAKHQGVVEAVRPCSEDQAVLVWVRPQDRE